MNRNHQLNRKKFVFRLTDFRLFHQLCLTIQSFKELPLQFKSQNKVAQAYDDEDIRAVNPLTRMVSILTSLSYMILTLLPDFAWAVRSEDFVGKIQHMTIRVQAYTGPGHLELRYPHVVISVDGFKDQVLDPHGQVLRSGVATSNHETSDTFKKADKNNRGLSSTLEEMQSQALNTKEISVFSYSGLNKVTVYPNGNLVLENLDTSAGASDPLMAMVRNLTITTPYDVKIRNHTCEKLEITSRTTYFLGQVQAIEANLNASADQFLFRTYSLVSLMGRRESASYQGQDEARLMWGKLTVSAHSTFTNTQGCVVQAINDGEMTFDLAGRVNNYSVMDGTGRLYLMGAGV